MIADTIQTMEATAEDEAAAARVVAYEWAQSGYYGVTAASGRQPRWQVRLAAPDEAAPLFKRAKADLRALSRLNDQQHTARLEAISRRWSGGDLTPNQRAMEMVAAEQERATREAHIEQAYQDLTEAATLERAKESAPAAIDRTWVEAMTAHDTPGPTAA